MKRKLRIAQIAPLAESVPPKYYGGTERVVSYLTEELVQQGHDVTLFASGDSQTRARLWVGCNEALRLSGDGANHWAYLTLMLEALWQQIDDFDIIHSHIDFLPFPFVRRAHIPVVSTMHGRLDTTALKDLFRVFRDVPLVSISDHQRTPIAHANWAGTIYHGLPKSLYKYNPSPEGYLAFLGRISPEKRVDSAIQIAQKSGLPLKIAAKVDDADRTYFDREIKHLLDTSGVEFIGEINDDEKSEFLGNARALLFPIDWPEPFGLVMIEALACGTPVIARGRGSVPEIIDDGSTGFIIDDELEAVAAVRQIDALSRSHCRNVFETRFSVERMTRDYVSVFEELMARHPNHSLAIRV